MAAPKSFAPLRVHVGRGSDPRVVFSGGPRGTHSIGVTVSDDARIRAHAEGYAWAACLGTQAESDFADEAVRVAGLWREQRTARLERQARERAAREGQVA